MFIRVHLWLIGVQTVDSPRSCPPQSVNNLLLQVLASELLTNSTLLYRGYAYFPLQGSFRKMRRRYLGRETCATRQPSYMEGVVAGQTDGQVGVWD